MHIKNISLWHQSRPRCSVGKINDLRTGGHWCDAPARPIFFPRTDDSYRDRIHSSPGTVHCFNDGYVGNSQWLGKNIVWYAS